VRNIYHRIETKESFDISFEEHKHKDVTAGSVQPIGPAFAANKMPSGAKVNSEAIRATKAEAVQQARGTNASRKIATAWLSKFVRLGFTIHASLNNKIVKKLGEDAKHALVTVKTDVAKMQKRLQAAMHGKGEQLDVIECKALTKKASDVLDRTHQLVYMKCA
jgi:hypothetical protein